MSPPPRIQVTPANAPTEFHLALQRIDALERQLQEMRLTVRQLELHLADIRQALVRSKEQR